MNAQEYQQACKPFAVYNVDNEVHYLALGYMGEFGELANKYKKVLRDHGGVISPEIREALLDECGDVLWYSAMLDDAFQKPFELSMLIAQVPCDDVNTITASLLMVMNGADWTIGRAVIYIIKALGSTPEEVFDRNIAKLTSRQERGVIGGSGDTR